jgi:phosphoglycerate dehydrogenase-like enzyme
MRTLPAKDQLTICFAHVAYRMAERFALRNTGIGYFEVRTLDELTSRLGEFDLLCVSMLWRNEFIQRAPRLAFIQSISAGTDQYARDALKSAGIRLASAQGVNAEAVAQHAMALILALTRQLHLAHDNQVRRYWRGMVSDLSQREDELGGKTLLVVGLGRIGSRLATLARCFGMRVVATKRDASTAADAADAVFAQDRLIDVLPQADIVALTCPLTPQTERLIGAQALAAMKPSAILVNVARGRVVDKCIARGGPLVHGRRLVLASPSHGENRGSSPLGSANEINVLEETAGSRTGVSPTFLQPAGLKDCQVL